MMDFTAILAQHQQEQAIEAQFFNRITHFYQRFCTQKYEPLYGAGHGIFALYASFPVFFTPDLLHKLWFNFKNYTDNDLIQTIHPVVVSDIILSGLTQEIGRDTYEMPQSIRFFLLSLLQKCTQDTSLLGSVQLPGDILRKIAHFTNYYAQNTANAYVVYAQTAQKAHQLNADMYLHPAQTLENIAREFEKSAQNSYAQRQLSIVTDQALASVSRVASSNQIVKSNVEAPLQLLLTYAQTLKKFYIEGASEAVSNDFKKLLAENASFTHQVNPILLPLPFNPNKEKRESKGYQTALQRIQEAKTVNATQLDLSNLGLTEIPEEIGELENLQVLHLSGNKITRIENLDKLPNLQQLDISSNKLTRIENLDKLPKLQQLDISHNQITKLENLDKLPKLQQLDISHNQITKLENLDKLPKLQQLVIYANQITKLENLDKLPNLEELDICENQIAKLENLDKLPNLQELQVGANKIIRLENLDKLPNLEELDIYLNKITKLENLDKLPKLHRLDTSCNQISRLENLDNLPNLQQLDIRSNEITQLENLDKLPNLRRLSIWQNKITKLENLDKLPNLQQLDIGNNQITKLENLDKLPNLQQLDIGNNQITDLSPLLPFLHRKEALFQLVFWEHGKTHWGEINVALNPLINPPIEIARQGNKAVLRYFEEQEKHPQITVQQLITQAKAEGWKRLDLGNCGLTDLETQVPELFELEQLEELVLSNKWHEPEKKGWVECRSQNKGAPNVLSSIPASIAKLKNLKVLIISGWKQSTKRWQIKFIEHLSALTQLRMLNLGYNKIGKIEGLETLINLECLVLANNQIKSIKGLDTLTNLEILDLDNNFITKLEKLDKLSNLKILSIGSNKISEIEGLDNLKLLIIFILSVNQITEIKGLDNLEQLQILYLSTNQITEIKGLDNLNQLQMLDLGANKISDLTPILPLSQTNKLQLVCNDNLKTNQINVKDNPLTTPPIAIVEQGNEAVLRYFEEQEKHSQAQASNEVPHQPDNKKYTISLFKDKDSDIDVKQVANIINNFTSVLKVIVVDDQIDFYEPIIIPYETADKYNFWEQASNEGRYRLLVSEKAYNNNYFFEGHGNKLILSFSDFKHLTNLPKENGLFYWLCKFGLHLIVLNWPKNHNNNCLNDFLGNKTFIDRNMRNARVCESCYETLIKQPLSDIEKLVLQDIQTLTEYLTLKSTDNQSVIDSAIHSISPAQKLIAQAKAEGWKRLDLGNCNLTDLETQVPELFELEQLEELVLGANYYDWENGEWEESENDNEENSFSKIPAAIKKMRNLRKLSLCYTYKDWDITPLSELSNLTALDLSYNQIKSIAGIEKLVRLTHLNLSKNPIKDEKVLSTLFNLQVLDLRGTGIENMSILNKLVKLQHLDISTNGIINIDAIESLTALSDLNASGNRIKSIVAIAALTNLKMLNLASNKITTISPLSNLTNLTSLYLNVNIVADITPLANLRHLQSLDLSNNKVIDITPLQNLLKLAHLNLSNNEVNDINNLRFLQGLNNLMLSKNNIANIDALKDLLNLNEVSLLDNKVTDLIPLLGFIRRHKELGIKYKYDELGIGDTFNELNLYGNPLTTPPIAIVEQGKEAVLRYFEEQEKHPQTTAQKLIAQAKAEGWKRLDLGNCNLTDLETQVPELFDLTDLEELVLSNKVAENKVDKERQIVIDKPNRLVGLPNQLSKLKQLKYLDCSGKGMISNHQEFADGTFSGGNALGDFWKITDISVVGTLEKLQVLKLANNPISDFSCLCTLSELRILDISSTKLNEMSFDMYLSCLVQLEELDITYMLIKNIEPLSSLKQLQKLTADSNQIQDITPLGKCVRLNYLSLRNNAIKDLSPLSDLVHLHTLLLRNNKIENITPLRGLLKLTFLDLAVNKITDITSLSQLSNLQELLIRNNKVNDIPNIDRWSKLVLLDLGRNDIKDIYSISSLNNIVHLYLDNNQIEDVASLIGLEKAQTIELSNNKISDIQSFFMAYHNQNVILSLKGNPLTTPPIEVVEQGKEAVLQYFGDLGQATQFLPILRDLQAKIKAIENVGIDTNKSQEELLLLSQINEVEKQITKNLKKSNAKQATLNQLATKAHKILADLCQEIQQQLDDTKNSSKNAIEQLKTYFKQIAKKQANLSMRFDKEMTALMNKIELLIPEYQSKLTQKYDDTSQPGINNLSDRQRDTTWDAGRDDPRATPARINQVNDFLAIIQRALNEVNNWFKEEIDRQSHLIQERLYQFRDQSLGIINATAIKYKTAVPQSQQIQMEIPLYAEKEIINTTKGNDYVYIQRVRKGHSISWKYPFGLASQYQVWIRIGQMRYDLLSCVQQYKDMADGHKNAIWTAAEQSSEHISGTFQKNLSDLRTQAFGQLSKNHQIVENELAEKLARYQEILRTFNEQ